MVQECVSLCMSACVANKDTASSRFFLLVRSHSLGTLAARSYSARRRFTSSPTGGQSCRTIVPWPALHTSFHAFRPVRRRAQASRFPRVCQHGTSISGQRCAAATRTLGLVPPKVLDAEALAHRVVRVEAGADQALPQKVGVHAWPGRGGPAQRSRRVSDLRQAFTPVARPPPHQRSCRCRRWAGRWAPGRPYSW